MSAAAQQLICNPPTNVEMEIALAFNAISSSMVQYLAARRAELIKLNARLPDATRTSHIKHLMRLEEQCIEVSAHDPADIRRVLVRFIEWLARHHENSGVLPSDLSGLAAHEAADGLLPLARELDTIFYIAAGFPADAVKRCRRIAVRAEQVRR
jgi:hypothetical protein